MEKNKLRLFENLIDDFIRNIRAVIFYAFLILFWFLVAIVFFNKKTDDVKKEPARRMVVIMIPDTLPKCGSAK